MNTKSVLVAEDEAMIAAMWKEALGQHNWSVVLAKNGVEAIEILENQNFDLLITDLRMPEKDGYAIINHIEQHKLGLPIVVCSGYIENETELAKTNSIKRLLKKPVDIAKEVELIVQEFNS